MGLKRMGTMDEAMDNAKDGVDSVMGKLGDLAEDAKEKVSDIADDVHDKVVDAKEAVEAKFHTHDDGTVHDEHHNEVPPAM